MVASSLRQVEWRRFLRGPDTSLLEELYEPALTRAVRYDRCCAYFSSRVLAVAARGFAGLIGNLLQAETPPAKPALRLLVNEQLDARDLAALTASGEAGRLIEPLLKRFRTPQSALEKARLEMLAWLVASGWLEVRVSLLRYTGGLSHAKFGLITDARGDTVAFMGSDNETGEALVQNYEELEVRPSWVDPEFTDYYRRRFQTLWDNADESVLTVSLPEAVTLKLIQLAPDKPPDIEPKVNTQDLKAAMLWHFLAAAPYLPQGEGACDATALVTPWPHQRKVVADAAAAFPAGRLLCDEVGMGKSIEALLILRRLLAGRGVRRALLLVPAGLLRQWQDELREKGGLLVPRWENGFLFHSHGPQQAMPAKEALATQDVLLLSREWARLLDNRQVVLTAPPWDLVIFDEAHAARRSAPEEREFNSGNLLLTLLRELQLRRRARGLLLLSATPMQTQPWEPWDLLAVLGIGGDWMVEFNDVRTYYQAAEALRQGPLSPPMAQMVAPLVVGDEEFPAPPYGLPIDTPQRLAQGLVFPAGVLKGQAVPSKQAQADWADWLRRGAPLGRRMHRNTRDTLRHYHALGLLDRDPPRRQVEDRVFDFQVEAERACYEAVTGYINQRYEQLEQEKPGKGFVMTVYRRRAASSPLALRRSLQRRADRLQQVIRRQAVEGVLWLEEEQIDARDLSDADLDERIDPALPTNPRVAQSERSEIEALLAQLDALGATDSKLDEFWRVLQAVIADGRSVLVFSEYTDTMEYLRDQLQPTYGHTLACYSGSGGQVWEDGEWKQVSKGEITERLERGQVRVLVCTDAASEGLNLQAAAALINYDLPWNPSKVEQRIGRIDRIGQQQRLLPICNLFLHDSVDMRVYQALRRRCGLFEHFVGKMQPVLAVARDALRRQLPREQVDGLLETLNRTAREVEGDAMVTQAFAESEAEPFDKGEPAATLQDLETALEWLSQAKGRVKAHPLKNSKAWRLTGLGRRALQVTTDRETLERETEVLPLTPLSPEVQQLTEKLPLAASSVPLLLVEYTAGSYRCVEARWVEGDRVTPVQTARDLVTAIEGWSGQLPSPTALLRAQQEALQAARRRVQQMEGEHRQREEAGLAAQREAARQRLLRELGRTLRCLGPGDLNAVLRTQLQREPRSDGRYHRALERLGSFPTWTADELRAIEDSVRRLKPSERQARILGSEVDAALEDPRWGAAGQNGRVAGKD